MKPVRRKPVRLNPGRSEHNHRKILRKRQKAKKEASEKAAKASAQAAQTALEASTEINLLLQELEISKILSQATNNAITKITQEKILAKKAKQKAKNKKKREKKNNYPHSCVICMSKFSSIQGKHLNEICTHNKEDFICYFCLIMNIKQDWYTLVCKCPFCRKPLNYSINGYPLLNSYLYSRDFDKLKQAYAKKKQKELIGMYKKKN